MLLAIDIGNTNIVFALCSGEALLRSWRCETDVHRLGEGYVEVIIEQGEIHATEIDDVIISSVVPAANEALNFFCQKQLGCVPIEVTQDLTALPIDLDNPAEIGADRLVNAVAVLKEYSAPAIVIDFGTATTFDVISTDGHYSGGVIAPGLNLSLAALHGATAKLPMVEIKRPQNVIGANTISAMQSGMYWGYVGLISGIIDRVKEEMDGKPMVIATGGLASLFIDQIEQIDLIDSELTLKGLLRIYQDYKNTNRQSAALG